MKSSIEFIARALLIHDAQVLLCQNVRHKYYFLPGGHIEFSESATAALTREMAEELGVRVLVGALAFASEELYSSDRLHHELNLVFHVALVSRSKAAKPPKLKSKEPKIAFEWFSLSQIQTIDLRPSTIRSWLSLYPPELSAQWQSGIVTSTEK
ncbi:MAG: NUDIX domain-containing protein [Pyrinomonadaceae bacterium]|nr:NUDIX domain-containing protein [Phycisphaerales bacterium]